MSENEVVIRVSRDMTAVEFCESLGMSRRVRNRAFERGLLRRGTEVLRRATALQAGDDLTLELAEDRPVGPASDAPVQVIWRDRFALVAEKPAGLLVHGDGTSADTLTARVQGLLVRETAAEPRLFVPKAQAVQRLDVETTGLVLFSLTEEFQPTFDALVASHDMRKRYVALIDRPLPAPSHDGWLTIDAPIARDRHDARRMRVGKTGKRAVTLVRELERRGRRTLVEAELVTGRRHQIRVHLAHVGCPLVGDRLYGGNVVASAGGLMLHAHELAFDHPVTDERIEVRSPLPARFAWAQPSRHALPSA